MAVLMHCVQYILQEEVKNNALKTAAFTLLVFAALAAVNGAGSANLLSAETMGQLTLGITFGVLGLAGLVQTIGFCRSAYKAGQEAKAEAEAQAEIAAYEAAEAEAHAATAAYAEAQAEADAQAEDEAEAAALAEAQAELAAQGAAEETEGETF